jgi:hypothetical protein
MLPELISAQEFWQVIMTLRLLTLFLRLKFIIDSCNDSDRVVFGVNQLQEGMIVGLKFLTARAEIKVFAH